MPPPSSHYLLRRRLHNGTARFWRQRATWTNIPTMSSGGAPPTRPANAQVDPRRAHLVRVLHRAAAMRPAASTVKGEGGLEKGTSWCRRDNPMGGGQKRTQVYAAQTHNQVTVITAHMLTLCALTDRGKDPYATAYGRRRGIQHHTTFHTKPGAVWCLPSPSVRSVHLSRGAGRRRGGRETGARRRKRGGCWHTRFGLIEQLGRERGSVVMRSRRSAWAACGVAYGAREEWRVGEDVFAPQL